MRFGVIRLDLQSPLVGGDCIGELALLFQSDAQVAVGFSDHTLLKHSRD